MTAMTDFPDDENGEVLRQMADAGVDLTAERSVEFAHLAPDEGTAHAFAREARGLGFVVELHEPDEESLEEGETDWDVICTRRMVPTHAAISETEAQLVSLARRHGCEEDGWGFIDE